MNRQLCQTSVGAAGGLLRALRAQGSLEVCAQVLAAPWCPHHSLCTCTRPMLGTIAVAVSASSAETLQNWFFSHLTDRSRSFFPVLL